MLKKKVKVALKKYLKALNNPFFIEYFYRIPKNT